MAVSIHHLRRLKERAQPIVALTAFEYATARLLDQSGVDLLLVGDSLAMVALGYPSTVPVSVEELLHHCRVVRRGVEHALLVADLPFGSYEQSPAQAFATASRFLKEAGAQAVKLEGGYRRMVETVAFLVESGVPVLAHIGLTPQAVHQLGGYRIQGKSEQEAARLSEQAFALEAAGAFAIVLEHIPAPLAADITRNLTIPTIGIGAGPGCDGQVLVTHDLLGLSEKPPAFAKPYVDLAALIREAATRYAEDVRDRRFPL
ncbi:3-methyl-2-oxobutanoate hydroxymethyltransferase [Gloeobacter kilaueensis]|uniref:3-methyl-2-oxobutanoate hydroxymethyltransferase n=1 Tax=Gloeobacter kilaueensis (strain ATCC BAA-2537 / CCAP 1431/1 / ULC 316 / JS1) TaxID=1183438 RepID=U5QGT4_GLOK1|nr:3-methyl-2-oxobutanoate hydroxymethyltransferase [Gloeobacter kilaueensis]AGY58192.1 3-methyl-2-oxobutanoate hydroxymethyltransferase [Gloeobacter kilaueensis JS1]